MSNSTSDDRTEFHSGDIVRTDKGSRGFKLSATATDGDDPPAMNNIGLIGSQAHLKVATVSHFRGKQRLLFPNIDAWFPAEDFTLVKRSGEKEPKCMHCGQPRGSHNQAGDCLKAGFYGNKFETELPTDLSDAQMTPYVNTLLEAGLERVALSNLSQGDWLLVAVEFSAMTGIYPVCFSSLGPGKPYDVFKVNPEAVMGRIEQPEWAKPPLPDEPPVWTVVKTVGESGREDGIGPVTIHVHTPDKWVDLSGLRRDWAEVVSLDADGKPEVLKPEEGKDEMGMFD